MMLTKGVAIRGFPKLCRAPPRRAVRAPLRVQAWLRPMSKHPRYLDLLSDIDKERMTRYEWNEIMQLDIDEEDKPPMSVKTSLLFFRGFFIHYVIPVSIRYIWYRFWLFSRRVFLYPLQKRWALFDARFDALLAKCGSGEYRFSRAMVNMRLHGRIGPWRELRYRCGLLLGKDVDHCTELFRLHSPSPSSQKNS